VEYQTREGYCGSATQRSVLRSIPQVSEIAFEIPPTKSGRSSAEKWAKTTDETTNGYTQCTVVYGSDGYDAFISAIKKVNDPKYRVAVNFLRSPLFEFNKPWWLPVNYVLGLFGGHFSPCIGYLEDQNLVAIFDVNHNYSTFLIDAKRLYEAVATHDQTTGKTRGLVVVEINN